MNHSNGVPKINKTRPVGAYVPPHLKNSKESSDKTDSLDMIHTYKTGYDILLGKKWSDIEDN